MPIREPTEDEPGAGALAGVLQLTLAWLLLIVPIDIAGSLSTKDCPVAQAPHSTGGNYENTTTS